MNYNHANEINAKIHDWLTNHDKSGFRVSKTEEADGSRFYVAWGVPIKYYPELDRLLAKHQIEAYTHYDVEGGSHALIIEIKKGA